MKGDGRPGKTDQPAVPYMEGVIDVAEHVDQLVNNLTNLSVISLGMAVPYLSGYVVQYETIN